MRLARRRRTDRFDLPRHAYNTKGNRGITGAPARLDASFGGAWPRVVLFAAVIICVLVPAFAIVLADRYARDTVTAHERAVALTSWLPWTASWTACASATRTS